MVINFKPKGRRICIASRNGPLFILLHPDKPVWTVINKVGYETLSFCDGNTSLEEIAHKLSRRYGMSFDSVLSDLEIFITRLAEKDFLLPPYPSQLKQNDSETTPTLLKKLHLKINRKIQKKGYQ